jgi:hypothetical protein
MMAAPLREVDIRDFRVYPSMDVKRAGKRDIVITYFVGAEGPFSTIIPYEELEGKPEAIQLEIIKNYIAKEQGERLKFIGKKFTL